MSKRRGIRPERNKDVGSGAPPVLRFFVRHGEKIAAGAFVAVAIWLAMQIQNYQPLHWKPNELKTLADNTEEIILNNEIDVELAIFGFTEYAAQQKEPVSLTLYRTEAVWRPAMRPAPLLRGNFEVLTAQSLRGEAMRRAGWTVQENKATQWQPPARPETEGASPVRNTAAILINLYGTLPVWEQWDIYNQVFDNFDPANRPEYAYYELERTKITPGGGPDWQPVDVYGGEAAQAERLILFSQSQEALQNQDLLLFSDFDIEPSNTYAYRIRLYMRNPNYNLQETSVASDVDTTSEFLQSDWSSFARVYVPDRTLVRLQSVNPSDEADFPRVVAPLRQASVTLLLDYFDVEQGLSLPLVEKRDVRRGMLGNMSKDEANRLTNRGNTGEIVAGAIPLVNYPDAGLRSNVCVMDYSGGRRLQKRQSREAQASPDMIVPGKALLLLPDGTIQVTSTESELFRVSP